MRLITNRKHCLCVSGCDIYTGYKKYTSDGKTYCVEHGRIKSLFNGFRIWLGQKMRISAMNTYKDSYIEPMVGDIIIRCGIELEVCTVRLNKNTMFTNCSFDGKICLDDPLDYEFVRRGATNKEGIKTTSLRVIK